MLQAPFQFGRAPFDVGHQTGDLFAVFGQVIVDGQEVVE